MQTITIGNRGFKGVGRDCTLAHDIWVMERVRTCGLDVLDKHLDESDDIFARRVFLRAAADPKFFELMGGLFIPVEIESDAWNEGLALETGRFLANVRNPKDKDEVKAQVVATLMSFLAFGLSSVRISPRSSPQGLEPQAVFYEAPEIMETGTLS